MQEIFFFNEKLLFKLQISPFFIFLSLSLVVVLKHNFAKAVE